MTRRAYVVAALLIACAGAAHAGDFPQRTVKLVVPFPAGGSTDVLARLLSLRLSQTWGYPVLVTNIPGNGSVTGTENVASASPDGHTLLVTNAALAIREALSRNVPSEALRNFAPVALLARQHLVLAVHGGSPVTSVEDLIDMARNSRAPVFYGTANASGISHLAGELLKLMTSGSFTHVSTGNARNALDELMAHRLTCAIVALPAALPYLKSGRLRAIAVAGDNRATALPDVPTIGASLVGYGISGWIGLLAPYGASVPLVRTINTDVQAIMRRPELDELLRSLGYEPRTSSPGDFQNRLRADIERYSRIVFKAGLGNN